ncbi:MAG TPA: CapA family protein [Candidatus Limnocylindria bacterium]|nr:CapA family protein [Candidatus Limnocylindria bacterium]
MRRPGRVLLALLGLMLVACGSADTSPTPSTAGPPRSAPEAATGTPLPTATPQPTPEPEIEVPLAVVTGFTNLRTEITADEVETARERGSIVEACEVFPQGGAPAACMPAAEVADHLVANPGQLALLPAGLVEPRIKALTVDRANLFGSADQRERPWPFTARGAFPAAWTHDPAEIRTLMSVGESCPDRGVAHQAITQGRGWEWVFGGGRARYTAIYPNPVPAGHVGNGFNIVDAVPSGDEGAVWRIIGSADVTVEDFECPVVDDWTVNEGVVFSIDPRVLGHMKRGGTDVVTLAANHLFDRGEAGFLQTLEHFDTAGILRTGAGADLDEALSPAVFDAGGLRFAVVGWNLVPGSVAAEPGVPGVAWMTEENIRGAVARARDAGDVVVCMPQWGYPEYRVEFTAEEVALQQLMLDAGCDHILGHGTHWASQIDFTRGEDGRIHLTVLSHGNFLFGQEWSQQTQEGMLVELAFRGAELVQVRLHPYIMLEQAQANLTDPQTDGSHLLNRVFAASDESY